MHQTCQGSYLYSKTGSQTTIKALWNTIICNSKGNENYFVILEDLQPSQRNIEIPTQILRLNQKKKRACTLNLINGAKHTFIVWSF